MILVFFNLFCMSFNCLMGIINIRTYVTNISSSLVVSELCVFFFMLVIGTVLAPQRFVCSNL